MFKLLIADSSEPYTDALADVLDSIFDLRICNDGDTALELMLSFRPDVLILNLQLPFKDGLTLLQQSAYRPRYILATTSYISPYVERCAASLGVTYTMLTPSVASVRVRIMDMIQQTATLSRPADLSAAAATHLHSLSFMTHMDGYQQLCEAIPLFYADPHQRLTKELYPAVAQICGCKDARSVEHSIRKAIEAAWKSRDDSVWCKYFPQEVGCKECPTNKAFISRLVQMLHI